MARYNVGDVVVLTKDRDGLLPGSVGEVYKTYPDSVIIKITDPTPGSHPACKVGATWSVFYSQIDLGINENEVFIEGDDDDDCI